MKKNSTSLLGLTLLLLTFIAAPPLWAALIHRYSFNDPAGDATAATLTDSVRGANGSVLGAGAVFTGTGLDLPGGSSDTAAYGDLPNNLVSPLTEVTFEGWVTIDAGGHSWARIFDFGSTEPGGGTGEVTGPGNTNGGGASGLDYIFLSAARGGDYNVQRVEVRNEDPAGGGTATFDSAVATTFGQPIHFAVTWKDTGVGTSEVNYWRDGVQLTTAAIANSNLADLNDVNNWLGRSTWLNDGNLDATFDEFRIYDTALTANEVSDSMAAGPDAVIGNPDDSDGDGLPDAYEEMFAFLNANDSTDAALDQDVDGLSNLEEFNARTKPDDDDTDDDGLTDGAEVNTHGTLPRIADTDGDGLSDGNEVNIHRSNPTLVDTDTDGLNDGVEVAGGSDPTLADATTPGVIHRYSFDAPAGAAPPSTVVADSIGGADGVIVGANGLWTGTALTLPGGDGATADAAYVDLPNGLMSSLDHLTFEAWYTLRSAQTWSRIWDFGSSEGGEILTGMTGNTQGQDYFLFAPNQGADINVQRYTVRNLDPLAPGGGMGPVDGDEEAHDTALASSLDQEYHVAGVWSSDGTGGAQLLLYRDGAFEGSRTTTFAPRDISDVNNWLGRSNWTGDAYLNGDLNEFRIYDGAMNHAAATASFNAGPDAPIGGAGFRITEIIYDEDANQFTLTWTSRNNRLYSLFWGKDLTTDLNNEIDDGILSGGEITTHGPFPNPAPGEPRLYFMAVENPPL